MNSFHGFGGRRAGWRLTTLRFHPGFRMGAAFGVVVGFFLAGYLLTFALAGAIPLPPREMTPTQAQMDPDRELWLPHADVMKVCAKALGSVARGSYYRACYLRIPDLVILPNDWPSRSETQDLRIHEHAHRVFGWRH